MYPPFQLILEQAEQIEKFLRECGGVYETITKEVSLNIIECLVWNQYIWTDNSFICYWLISPEDVEDIKERIKPEHRIFGSVMYIVECGCKGNLRKEIPLLRQKEPLAQGVLWHRPAKQDKVYYFPSQRGEERIENGK